MQHTITKIHARQILDSRGTPTVEVDVTLDNGILARASVPSGASTGAYEAIELRDKDCTYYFGKSVRSAVNNVNNIIAPALIGHNVTDQNGIDQIMIELDGTPNKSVLGANAILGVSLAVAKAGALSMDLPLYTYLNPNGNTLPTPMMNVINGGKHADNNLNIQEFMIVPVSATSWSQALQMCAETFHALKSVLHSCGYVTNVGDEGGFAPNFNSDTEALDFIVRAITEAGYRVYDDFRIALDVASSEMYNEANAINQTGKYYFWKSKKLFTVDQLLEYYRDLIDTYPIISIEDAFAEEDWEAWAKFTARFGDKLQIVGDDLFVTNSTRLSHGIQEQSANAILVKLNQIGTLTETIEAINLAQSNGINCVISHRSGETEDNYIADIAVACNAGQIKTGAPSRSDRVAKYNQLLRIEEQLGDSARFLGGKAI